MVKKSSINTESTEDVNLYLENCPEDVKIELERIREVIKRVVPSITERVSYKIPIFRLNKDLVGFAYNKNYCSFYVMSPDLVQNLEKELSEYKVSGATIHFTVENPLPEKLIELILKKRVVEDSR